MTYLIGPLTQLLTLEDLPAKGPIADDLLKPFPNGGILFDEHGILETGDFEKLKAEVNDRQVRTIELNEDFVCLPGLVDSHTHICFGGSRARDYAMRTAGKSYLEIAAEGGGILDTVGQTRKASLEELVDGITTRISRHLSEGVTTCEVKSGYGLSVDEELKMLRAIQQANTRTPADLIATCLAAHTVPSDFAGTKQEYLSKIIEKLFPVIVEEKLASRIDAFIEQGAFQAEDVVDYFTKAQELGFDITVHADQFTATGSNVAARYDAMSADHLEASTDKEIACLAAANVAPVVLPGASLGLGCNYAPARKLLNAGLPLVIASDWNPGSAPMGDLLCQAAILGAAEKLSAAEIFAAITYRAARVLGLNDRGQLAKGQKADFILFPTSDYREILYHQGKLKPAHVYKNGQKIN
ncbi:imidazolonepropionase [Mangrovibacterium lignilyticum]|uniref:imidazolonepropionase n=1 Tax=Mangrovibacterium lignilyticum TaxID=2668052 RepID=UPI0013D4BBF0|nr:imidazolonepropionase [Mangrovibacterium lignilyticum]